MIRFNDGQFEIAIATYKRPDYIKGWLRLCYNECVERNIKIRIIDSSPDEDTKKYIDEFNDESEEKVLYCHVSPSTNVGYKPMIPILESESEYLWVCGDSRYHDFDELDKKVFPYVKEKKIDYICINISNNYKLPDTIYDDKSKMLHDVFVASTCLGLSIYKMSIFDPIKKNPQLLKKYDDLFKDNYGFGWLGYFYNLYAMENHLTLLADVKTFPVLDKKKHLAWAVRFYGCWVEDLCQIIDNIPECYIGKNNIPKNTWKIMSLDAIPYCYLARKKGDLNAIKYKELENKGYFTRIIDDTKRIKKFAEAPMVEVECLYLAYRIYVFSKRVINRVLSWRDHR